MRKIEETRNGYIIDKDSTNEEWQEICKGYDKVRCIICNRNTSKCFRPSLLSNNIITINNTLLDGIIYINGIY